ncbi:hypothetical protein QTG54_013222 [Skeletonema marinoi]|uniref:Pectinesterase inhibitor domain-containing protein n=1 Tax=Skeletonema marinoi TaxID=267567 RepID=A0AAD8XY86_9STRA|nr:hypothetical protein QTG54_013222 [Skeletonema marinoi]
MKSIISVAAIYLSLTPASMAFVPASPYVATPLRTSSLSMAELDMTPELEAAVVEVRECASAFGEDTAHFANVWIDKMIEGNMDGTAAGLLDECVLDDSDKCENFSKALSKLDGLLGVVAGEQY